MYTFIHLRSFDPHHNLEVKIRQISLIISLDGNEALRGKGSYPKPNSKQVSWLEDLFPLCSSQIVKTATAQSGI